MNPWGEYFKKPFPSVKGFSAYRFPGLIVHLPVIGAFLLLGLLLLSHAPGLMPLLALYLVAGVYLGRDLAILCHYAPLLIIVCMAAALAGLHYVKQITDVMNALPGISPTWCAAGVTFLLSAVFLTYVRWYVNRP